MKRGFVIAGLMLLVLLASVASATKYKSKGWRELGVGSLEFTNAFLIDSSSSEVELKVGPYMRSLKIGLIEGGIGYSPPIGFGGNSGIVIWPVGDEVLIDWYLRASYSPFVSWKENLYGTVGGQFRANLFLEGNLSFYGYSYEAELYVTKTRIEVYPGVKTGVSSSFWIFPIVFPLSAEVGWRSKKLTREANLPYYEWYRLLEPQGFYFKISTSLAKGLIPIEPYPIEPPQVVLVASWADIPYVRPPSVLEIPLRINIRSEYGISGGVCSVIYPQGVSGVSSFNLRKIKGWGNRTITIPIKVSKDAVPGLNSLTFSLGVHGKDGEWRTKTATIRIRVVSPAATPVAVIGMTRENLCDLILPVSESEAEFRAEYSRGKLTILNLTTGRKNEIDAASQEDAIRALNSYFEGGDQTPPLISLSVRDGAIIPAESLQVTVYLSDDKLLGNIKFDLNNREVERLGLGDKRKTQQNFTFPLKWSNNKLRFEVTDAAGYKSIKEVTVTRIKGEGTFTADERPYTEEPPILAVKVTSTTQTNTLMGGTMGGVIVTIHNSGKGYADNVKVTLSGDQQICDALGNSKEIEEIAPGDSAVVTFRRTLPADLERKQTRLKVSVTADNYHVSEEEALTLNLFPKPEDVDTDIPSSGIRRDGYALIVGISQYQRTRGPQYALNDAEVFSMYAEKVLGIPASNIELMFDEEATWKSLESKIKTLGGRSGFSVLYFAGHGSFDVENPRSEKAFLAPYDWDPEDASSLLSVDWLLDEVDPGAGDTTLVILDACFTGGEGRSVQVAARPAVMTKLPTEHGSIVMASSEGSQISLEFDHARHGMFTYYLLSGLKGNAAGEGGWIYLDNLYNYVREEVKAATNNRQTPVLKGSGSQIKVGRRR